jgi:hypothetical protein
MFVLEALSLTHEPVEEVPFGYPRGGVVEILNNPYVDFVSRRKALDESAVTRSDWECFS